MSAFILSAARPTRLAALIATLFLAACGGGGGGGSTEVVAGVSDGASQAAGNGTENAEGKNKTAVTTRADAFRLVTQATFGATDQLVNRATTLGATAWVDDQLNKPPRSAVHLARWDADDKAVKALRPKDSIGGLGVVSSFYQHALLGDDQLRQRVAYALAQIFVVSMTDLGNDRARTVASYHDMLTNRAFDNFRKTLEDVAMHPAMGLYLSHLKNRKEDIAVGRVPDQNFARELMQLFSIGLVQLNIDGTPKLDGYGKPLESYSTGDVEGLSYAFTGFSWGGADTLNSRFAGTTQDPNRLVIPMQGYPQYHSLLPKTFLGTTVPGQGVGNPNATRKAALDTVFNHPNVGPFIGRQLIQRLVTSSPSPAYVARVASVFNNNGAGVRGDMKAVVRAILLDDEARSATIAASPQFGKVKEPVLRLTAYLRAFNVKSDSGKVLMSITDDPGFALGQTPLRSPSVFNFYRPGYVPPGGEAADAGMTVPELQITDEASVAGYANYMMGVVQRGTGQRGADGKAARPDLQVDLSTLLPLAANAGALVDKVNAKLLGDGVSTALRNEMVSTVESIVIPALKANGSNQLAIDRAKNNRLLLAVSLPLVTPEFIVQK
jgi:uncharacterized protein (DUF1800 family)